MKANRIIQSGLFELRFETAIRGKALTFGGPSLETCLNEDKLLTGMEKEDGRTMEETRVMELFRSKWALSILDALSDDDLRFNELKRAVGDAPSNTLSDRLSDLEAEQLITRTIKDDSPPSVTYALAPRGQQVVEIIERIERL